VSSTASLNLLTKIRPPSDISLTLTTLLKMNKKAVLKARRYANEIVVLSVGVDFWGNHVLKEVFGKSKVVSVRDMSDGGRILVNKFKLAVLDTLK